MKNTKHFGKIFTCLIGLIVACSVAFGIYASDYYHANLTPEQYVRQVNDIQLIEGKNYVLFTPGSPKAGFVFYPGGKVEYTAYSPLMCQLAQQGVACVIVKMPLNFAFMDMNAADKVIDSDLLPGVTSWYIGGHSLGGAMAASYVAKRADRFSGLVLLGAYSTRDLTCSGLPVLSVYGSEDGVLSREKYAKCFANLPEDTTEIVIDGGCHAYFGDYGPQSGDGIPAITLGSQLEQTANAIIQMMYN